MNRWVGVLAISASEKLDLYTNMKPFIFLLLAIVSSSSSTDKAINELTNIMSIGISNVIHVHSNVIYEPPSF